MQLEGESGKPAGWIVSARHRTRPEEKRERCPELADVARVKAELVAMGFEVYAIVRADA